MGMFAHRAILITTDSEHADLIARYCNENEIPILRDIPRMSGFVTLLVPPDGGKDGGEVATMNELLRKQLVDFLKTNPEHHIWCSWAHVQYGELGSWVIEDN